MDDYLNKINTALNRLQGAYAPNTLNSYYADARSFVDWCRERNIKPFPIASETLCAYIECLQVNSAYSTIRRRIASLRRLNRMMGFKDQTRTEEVYFAQFGGLSAQSVWSSGRLLGLTTRSSSK